MSTAPRHALPEPPDAGTVAPGRDAGDAVARPPRHASPGDAGVASPSASTGAEPAIVVDDLVVVRGSRTVLPGLSVTIPRGRVTGLLGPSGGGKSTLIRAIVGVQRVRSGTVTVLGEPAGSPGLRRRVGYVTQAPSVYRDLTIRQNVAYFGGVLGAPASDVDWALQQVDLADHAHQSAANLSGGQLSRVSLACALVGRPDVLVLDEPTVGLDPVLRRSLWQLFHDLAAGGTTLLVSSHVMDEAQRADRLLLLRDGRLLADETFPELLAQTGTEDAESAFLALIDRTPATDGEVA